MDRFDELIIALKDPEKEKRQRAARALGEAADPRAIEPLMDLLHSHDEDDRQQASLGLRMIGKASVPALVRALHDPDARVREIVARDLSILAGAFWGVDLDNLEPSKVSFDPLLVDALADSNKQVREEVAGILGRTGDPRATDCLLKALHDKEPNVRSRVAEALGKLHEPRAIDALISALSDRDSNVRRRAAMALGKWRETRVADALISALNDKDKSVRRAAALALAETQDPRAVEILITNLRSRDQESRKAAARALGQLGDPQSLPELDRLAKEGKRALFGLEYHFDLRQDDIQWDMQSESFLASDAAAKIRLRQLSFEQLSLAMQDGDSTTRQRIAIMFAKGRDARGVEPLIGTLNDPDKYVRKCAAHSLREIGDARAVEPLISALNDNEEDVRVAAIQALAQIGDARALPALELVANEEVPPEKPSHARVFANGAIYSIKKKNRAVMNE
jgi:HEAT repeat protein